MPVEGECLFQPKSRTWENCRAYSRFFQYFYMHLCDLCVITLSLCGNDLLSHRAHEVEDTEDTKNESKWTPIYSNSLKAIPAPIEN